ncbi:hypothetical protein OUY22_08810 [Nonomuraea sp. MCN248]|uniref:Uncharacterized protein n=1 Tax=Nonomuraea corallina TaxID=2989783 RepID=A0ABT4S8L4_9ACTN|nr:hypothetical protein [Nonomuraea corallina]MDA0633516.1 hypothetical protein [Nonomuraea corallina]
MSKNRKNRARKLFTTVLASVGLVYLGVTIVAEGTSAADEAAGIIGGFALILTALGLFRARGEPPPGRAGKDVPGGRPEAMAGSPISLTTTGAHALAAALGLPVRPTCEPQPGSPECPRLTGPHASGAAAPCPRRNGSLVVVVLGRPGCRAHP